MGKNDDNGNMADQMIAYMMGTLHGLPADEKAKRLRECIKKLESGPMSELHDKRLKARDFRPGMLVRWLKRSNFDSTPLLICEVRNQGTSRAAIRFFEPDGRCVWNSHPGDRFVLISEPNVIEHGLPPVNSAVRKALANKRQPYPGFRASSC